MNVYVNQSVRETNFLKNSNEKKKLNYKFIDYIAVIIINLLNIAFCLFFQTVWETLGVIIKAPVS